ncbi:hypothetical protein [Flavobacterium sp. M31R6]|uniref:hypothetical protein n=1 Tax=Flavobacterium sp. M31R6 TaxID=2739062 RepID=UPI00156A5CF8|nr:hypothetical protein [Flavobacterium sp. M31R6]QKJ64018.1 hypothetical protein HQN62_13065 [Flavobacterium sp. M31R6]
MKHITRKVVLSCTTEKKLFVFTMTQVNKDSQNEISSKKSNQFNIPINSPNYSSFWTRSKKVYLQIIIDVVIGVIILFIQKKYF